MTQKVNLIRFKLKFTLSGGYISRPHGAAVRFKIPELSDWNAVVVLESPPEEEQGPGERLLGYVYAECPVSAKLEEFVRAFIQERLIMLPPDVTLPIRRQGDLAVRDDGSFVKGFRPRLEECPLEVQALVDDVRLKLTGPAFRFLYLIRWQQGTDFGSRIISGASLFWNTGEPKFHAVPSRLQAPFEVGMSRGVEWESCNQAAIEQLWGDAQSGEPLGHRLLRSAASLQDESPEAAILILATALEAGIKSHVCRLEPANKWLMEKMPSPPIPVILSEYLPKLHAQKNKDASLLEKVKPWVEEVREIFRKRNVTAHTGSKPSLSEEFRHYVEKASDVLYLLDVIEGHEWAKQRVSPELCAAVGWPPPSGSFGRLTVQIL
jgi:hypothetical protein